MSNIFDRILNLDALGWLTILLGTFFFYLFANLIFSPRSAKVHQRIEDMQVMTEGSERDKLKRKSTTQKFYLMAEQRIIGIMEKNFKKGTLAPLEMKLIQAGFDNVSPLQHHAKKIIYAIGLSALALLGVTMAKWNAGFIAAGALLGFILPDRDLKEKVDKRQLKIKAELPDFLDLLAATAEGAKNLEDAIKQVCQRSEGHLTNEFLKTLAEVNSGRRRRDALKSMADRIGIEEVNTLVSQINQSETFGTGVEKTLIVQAEKMRKLKKLLAEIKARKASVLLILPSLLLLITALIIIAGPSIVAIFDAQSAMK